MKFNNAVPAQIARMEHRKKDHTGRLRANLRALRDDLRMIMRETPDLDPTLANVIRHDLNRANQLIHA